MPEKLHPASPAYGHGDLTHGGAPGITRLEWYAGQALAGLVTPPRAACDPEVAAQLAFEIAEEMVKEANRRENP